MMTVHDLYTIPADVLKHSNILLKRTKYGFDNGGIPYSVISEEDAQQAHQALNQLSIVLGNPDAKIGQLTKAINDAGAAGIKSHPDIEDARELRGEKEAAAAAAARDEYSTPEAMKARAARAAVRANDQKRVDRGREAAAAAAGEAEDYYFPDDGITDLPPGMST